MTESRENADYYDVTVTQGFTRRRNTIRALLEQQPRSAAELTMLTGYCDPRSYIRYLRNRGVEVEDVWHKCPDGTRFKVYYITGTSAAVGRDGATSGRGPRF